VNTLFLGSFVDKPPDEVAGDENCGTDRQEISAIFVGVRVEWLTWDSLTIFASLLLCSFLCLPTIDFSFLSEFLISSRFLKVL
jgi:hypothetical protein